MNTLSITQFTIADTIINVVDGLYSLNDLHKASGGESKHQPAFFVRNKEVADLVEEIKHSANLQTDQVIRKINGGIKRGTYVCKELVYRYAMWISPKFALLVIRTFDAMVTRTDSEQRTVLRQACERLSPYYGLVGDIYNMVGEHFGYSGGIVNIPTPLLPEAVAFVYDMILARQKAKDISRPNNESWHLLTAINNELKHAQMSVERLMKLNVEIGNRLN